MNAALLNILLHAVSAAPAMLEHVTEAFKQNWDVPHVQQARQGIRVLGLLLDDLEGRQQPQG